MKKLEGTFMPSKLLIKIAETISKAKAYLIGNSMDKVLSEALKLFEKIPENERTIEHLKEILNIGIEKRFEERRIILKLKTK